MDKGDLILDQNILCQFTVFRWNFTIQLNVQGQIIHNRSADLGLVVPSQGIKLYGQGITDPRPALLLWVAFWI